MANKRDLKRYVRNVCGDLATEILIASYIDPRIQRADVERVVNEIAAMQEDTLAHCSFSFDRSRRDFESDAAYRKARHAYNKIAYRKLHIDFNKALNEVVHNMNEALPAEVKADNKKLAAE